MTVGEGDKGLALAEKEEERICAGSQHSSCCELHLSLRNTSTATSVCGFLGKPLKPTNISHMEAGRPAGNQLARIVDMRLLGCLSVQGDGKDCI